MESIVVYNDEFFKWIIDKWRTFASYFMNVQLRPQININADYLMLVN